MFDLGTREKKVVKVDIERIETLNNFGDAAPSTNCVFSAQIIRRLFLQIMYAIYCFSPQTIAFIF